MKTLVEFAADYISNQADRRGHLTEAKTSRPSLPLDHPAWEDAMPPEDDMFMPGNPENEFHPDLVKVANKMKSLQGHKLKYKGGKEGHVSVFTPSGKHMGSFTFGGYDSDDHHEHLVKGVNEIIRQHYDK